MATVCSNRSEALGNGSSPIDAATNACRMEHHLTFIAGSVVRIAQACKLKPMSVSCVL